MHNWTYLDDHDLYNLLYDRDKPRYVGPLSDQYPRTMDNLNRVQADISFVFVSNASYAFLQCKCSTADSL